jgi:hypothetical protein
VLNIRLTPAVNGTVVHIADDNTEILYLAVTDEDLKKVIAQTVNGYMNDGVSNQTTPEPEIPIARPNRAARRRANNV